MSKNKQNITSIEYNLKKIGAGLLAIIPSVFIGILVGFVTVPIGFLVGFFLQNSNFLNWSGQEIEDSVKNIFSGIYETLKPEKDIEILSENFRNLDLNNQDQIKNVKIRDVEYALYYFKDQNFETTNQKDLQEPTIQKLTTILKQKYRDEIEKITSYRRKQQDDDRRRNLNYTNAPRSEREKNNFDNPSAGFIPQDMPKPFHFLTKRLKHWIIIKKLALMYF